jgi:hypothetical protein
MKNLLDIQCPKCRNTDNLHLLVSDELLDLGPYFSPDECDKVVALWDQVVWNSPIFCYECGHEGPIAGFEGDIPTRLARQMEARVMARFREAMTLDYRKK